MQPSPNGKANQREARPEPTATPITISTAANDQTAADNDDGEVVKVYVENGQAVQYGERLFAVKPA